MRKALITRPGKEPLILPIIDENNKGFFCRTGPNDSPAIEWFPFSSNMGYNATELSSKEAI